MEVFFKLATELIKTTKAFWLVLLGAGIVIYAHNKTTKLTNESNIRIYNGHVGSTPSHIIPAMKMVRLFWL